MNGFIFIPFMNVTDDSVKNWKFSGWAPSMEPITFAFVFWF